MIRRLIVAGLAVALASTPGLVWFTTSGGATARAPSLTVTTLAKGQSVDILTNFTIPTGNQALVLPVAVTTKACRSVSYYLDTGGVTDQQVFPTLLEPSGAVVTNLPVAYTTNTNSLESASSPTSPVPRG